MMSKQSHGQRLLQGTTWMIAARWVTRCVGLVSMLVLARLLSPEDYGLMAIALLAYGLLETISYAGVDLALMRQGNDSREHFDTAWTIQLIQGGFVAALLLIAAPIAATYFAEPRAIAVIQFMALRSIIEGAQNIGVVTFRKELNFAKEFRFALYVKLINFVVIVGAAIWFRNYWALVLGMVSASVISVCLSYLMHPYRPRLSLAAVSQIWAFSQWLIIARVGTFLNRKADAFIVGGVAGTSAIGNYHLASDLATMPSTEVVMPMRRALFPNLTSLSGQPSEFSAMVLNSLSMVAALCFCLGFGLMAVATEVVQLFLGSKWANAIPLIQWLAVFGAFSGLILILEVPLWVSGRTNLSAVASWGELVILVPLAWLAVHASGAEGAAMARAGVAAGMVPVMMYLSTRSGDLRFGQLVEAAWRPLVAAIAMATCLMALTLPIDMPLVLRLAIKIVLGALVYPLSLLGIWWLMGRPTGCESAAWRELQKRIG